MTEDEGPRCVAAVSNDEKRHKCLVDRPARATDGYLCFGHYSKLKKLIRQTPAVVEWLRRNLQPGQAVGEKVSGTPEDPAPLRVGVLDQADTVRDLLTSWCRMVCEERSLELPTDIHDQAEILVRQADWIAQQRWVTDLMEELSDAAGDAHGFAPWKPGRHKLGAPCPACDAKALVRDDGEDQVHCEPNAGGCDAAWTEADYTRLTLILADEMRRAG